MRDWRMIALLGAFAPMSLNHLAREANLDKSQASRTVADLIRRGHVRRESDAADGRGIRLGLTASGKTLYRRVFPQAVARNEALLASLTRGERAALDAAFVKLIERAHAMLADEKRRVLPRKTPARHLTGEHHVSTA